MAGNVWEWTSDQFRPDTYRRRLREVEPGGRCRTRPDRLDRGPAQPHAPDSRVQKGGSFCATELLLDTDHAKMAAPPDTGMTHLGFRCVANLEATDDLSAADSGSEVRSRAVTSGVSRS